MVGVVAPILLLLLCGELEGYARDARRVPYRLFLGEW
jgi:hypothetical protein